MNQLARCAYPNCNRPFIKTRASKLYCSVQCTDKAAHARARKRGKLAVEQYEAHLTAEDQRLAAAAAAELAKLEAAPPASTEPTETFASAIASMGFEPTAQSSISEADITEKAYQQQGRHETRSGMPSGTEVWTREQVEADNRKREEDRLIALDKAARAQKKRERAIARAQILEHTAKPESVKDILRDTIKAKDEEI